MDSSQPKSASPSSLASASSSSSIIWEFSGAPTTSYSFFPVREEEEVAAKEAEDDSDRPSLLVQKQTGVGYHVHYPTTTEDEEISRLIRDDTWSCIIVVLTFWFFGFAQWLEDISYPNTTLSWNVIHGSGIIQQDIFQSSTYYVAVGKLNPEEVEVQLNISLKAFLYNTSDAYYNCAVAHGGCSLKMFFRNGNAAVLTSPGPEQGTTSDQWYVKLSYGPRWITYLVGIGVMTVFMLLAFHFLNNFQCTHEEGNRFQFGELRSERAPLLTQKDDDLSSWGSSYDSVSQDDEDLEDGLAVGSLEGKPLKDGEYNNNIRRLCAICFDAPRDCFFLPCGHCVACFACGTRIADLAGTCPICRRNMKKVRKIFTV